jgi:hypothetical protein
MRKTTHERLSDGQSQLVADHWPFAQAIAEDASRRWPLWLDDFQEAAAFALIDVAATWTGRENVPFHVRAKSAIERRLQEDFRDVGPTIQPFSDWPNVEAVEAAGVVLMAEPEQPADYELELSDTLDHLIRDLPLSCRKIVDALLRYGEVELASEHLRMSRRTVRATHERALKWLRASRDARKFDELA